MVDIFELTDAVADVVSAFGETEVTYVPTRSLKTYNEPHIIVIPIGVAFKPLGHNCSEQTLTIKIGVFKTCDADDVSDLINKVIAIMREFLDKRLVEATCTEAICRPLCETDLLREYRQFLSIVWLTFKAVDENEKDSK